jgi:UDP-GlcNAc:undecaprenyl-phosphate GlcNAc-1-phosphate transferase
MQGDKRHFSHRLVDLGMSTRQAVTFIYLVGGVCGLGAALLPHLDFVGTGVVLVQILGIYMLVILLMNVQKNGVPRREK